MSGQRVAVVVPDRGGGRVELLADALVAALARAGHAAEAVRVPCPTATLDEILASYVRFYDLDLSAFDLVISTGAPSYLVRHPNHVSYLAGALRPIADLAEARTAEQRKARRLILHLDAQALLPPRTRRHLAVGRAAFERLFDADPAFRSVWVTVLQHPPLLAGHRAPQPAEHVLVAGSLRAWKRVGLVIAAYRKLDTDLPLVIAGAGEEEAELRRLAGDDARIRILGRVSDDELLDLHARALVVPVVPVAADHALAAIEAFFARKPVLTCSDSGEPRELVRDLETGLVCAPDASAIAEKLAWALAHRDEMAAMGERGGAGVARLSWEQVVDGLVGAAAPPRVTTVFRAGASGPPCRVLITDNQTLHPATGGSRQRLLGLYGSLPDGVVAEYVGAFDWQGPGRREVELTPSLREIDVPLSREHFGLAAALQRLEPDRPLSDVTLPWIAWSSPALLDELSARVAAADVVVLSHPWMYPAIREVVRRAGKPLVYDAHDCEALLRGQLLGGTALGDSIAGTVRFVEALLCQEAAAVLASSEEDRSALVSLHGVPASRVHVVPNGTFPQTIRPPTDEERAAARKRFGLGPFAALFLGTSSVANVEAARFIVADLAPALPEVTFAFVGAVADTLGPARSNVVAIGQVAPADLPHVLAAADVALNPTRRGSGGNVQMLDYFAAGLPVVTTAAGARGLAGDGMLVAELGGFAAALRRLADDASLRARMGAAARREAETRHDWLRIGRDLGELLLATAGRARPPAISVVVPSYQRPEQLRELLALLGRQDFTDFEVIVVDQSAAPLDVASLRCRFPLRYLHTTERGAVKARNLGLRHARGATVAFTDDDCRPDADWLARAAAHLADPGLAGIEGLVRCDQGDRQRYRVVSNESSNGGLFMTANLFVRRAVLESLGGFDERFEAPHFREDTDLGWRALAYGPIPFARDVAVLHPAEPLRASASREGYFVHDALLYFKHPERYLDLISTEGHHRQPAFWHHFAEGITRHRLPISAAMLRQALGVRTG